MNTLDYISLALGGGLSLAAVVYALYTSHSLAVQIASQATTIVVQGGKLSDSERNALSYQQQRDTQTKRADLAEAQLADVTARLKSTQAALVKAQQESTDAKVDAVRNSPDPNAELDRLLASSDRSNVPAAGDSSTSDGGQGSAAVRPAT